MGHESAARAIAVEKRWRAGDYKLVGWAGCLKNRFLWFTTNYGYAPFRAIIWLLLLTFLVGPLGFSRADRAGLVVPKNDNAYQQYVTKASLPGGYEPFNPWHYSLDLLPPLDLGQKSGWHLYPVAGIPYWHYRFYFAFLISYVLACYVLLALAVAAFTGLIKKD